MICRPRFIMGFLFQHYTNFPFTWQYSAIQKKLERELDDWNWKREFPILKELKLYSSDWNWFKKGIDPSFAIGPFKCYVMQ